MQFSSCSASLANITTFLCLAKVCFGYRLIMIFTPFSLKYPLRLIHFATSIFHMHAFSAT